MNFSSTGEHRLAHVALCLTGVLCLIINSGYSYGPAMLVLMGLGSFSQRPALPAPTQKLFVAVVAFSVGNALFAAYHGEGWGRVSAYLQFLGVIPLVWIVVRLKLNAMFWFVGVALGGVLAAMWSLWQVAVEGVTRAGGHTYVIQHGNIGMLMGFTSLMGALYIDQHRRLVVLMLVGALAGFMVSILSGTRGGWVGAPLAAWVAWRAFAPLFSVSSKRLMLALIASLLAVLVLVPATGVQQRVDEAVDELTRLTQGDASGGSVVPRLFMWELGAELVMERPVMGWGQEAFDIERDRQMQLGETQLTLSTNHLHNELIDTAVKHGIIGAALLVLLYWAGASVFSADYRAASKRLRALAASGLLLVLLYIDFGLSQTMFYRNSGRIVFIAWLGITYGLWLNERAAQRAH